jgi:drug/metabolite transporter (DMT)-like permease
MVTSTIDNAEKSQDRVAFWAILLIPFIWGIGFPLTHNAVAHINPGLYAFSRSLVAALTLMPFALPLIKKTDRRTLVAGLVLGIFSALNAVSQSYALSYLSSATTAFCVTLNIIFIPFIMMAMRGGKPSRLDIASVAIGLLGVYIILGPKLDNLSIGYLWGGLAAFAIAMNICIVGKLTSKGSAINRLALGFYQMLFGTLALVYFPLSQSLAPIARTEVWIAIVFMGMLSTALAVYLQTRFQQRVGSTRTSVIFNLDLVFASLFGLLNKEPLSGAQVVGGVIIFLASMLESTQSLLKKLYSAAVSRWAVAAT